MPTPPPSTRTPADPASSTAPAAPAAPPAPLTSLHDRAALAERFGRDPELHLFELGDLDEPFWSHTTWYTASADGPVALLYAVGDVPTLLGLARPAQADGLAGLLDAMRPVLPRRLLAHLTEGGVDALAPHYRAEHRTAMLRMALTEPAALAPHLGGAPDGPGPVVRLGAADLTELRALFAAGYPGNWFDERMLTTGPYVGVRDAGGRLLATAGVHVHSAARRVAVIGNVTTHPEARGRGLAAACTARLCEVLADSVDHIGLNVRADHPTALALYRRLGFTTVTGYEEAVLTAC
ncbi:FR47-like protein [Streptomyces sp. TLI_053]|uniref:GNAT family N-acetyltransferase n=1 Tax=Streptomyces sp. TLI_053 TaxID=1855352 RepID=UPI00087D726C|nr:GNAT family N-acetyltransferase [Streptomyces sp. TLI_053]SDT81004.1 FR47-like protein [Streptomyces sp. TLI_053]